VRVVAVVALLTGCLSKPPRPGGDPDPDGGVVGCTASAFRDDFEAGTEPCGVAFPSEAGTCVMKRSNGVLTMSPGIGDGNDCSCTTPEFLFADGIFVEVIDSTGPGGTYTILQLMDPPVTISVQDDGATELHMAEGGNVLAALPYNGTTQRWWRLRPDNGVIVGEYSETGASWTRLAATTAAPPMRTQVSLNSGSFGTAQPMTATFDNLGTCPP
jgi:hypothetical protein